MDECKQRWYDPRTFEQQGYQQWEPFHEQESLCVGRYQEWTPYVEGYMTPLPPCPQVEALSSSGEAMLAKILANQNEMIQSIRNEVASTTQGLHKLERQVEQIASELREQFAEEDAKLEAMYNDRSTKEEESHPNPCQDEESHSMPCHVEEVGESSTVICPPSKEHNEELPMELDRTLSTHLNNERIEIKVLLPLNPPFSAQCFYDEVKDWKGSDALVHNPPSHFHTSQLPTPSLSIIAISNLKEESTRILERKIGQKRKRRRWPPLRSSFEDYMDYFCVCLFDVSRSPLAPSSKVVLVKKYTP